MIPHPIKQRTATRDLIENRGSPQTPNNNYKEEYTMTTCAPITKFRSKAHTETGKGKADDRKIRN